jgi:uncharacterized phiE125 gp8 family phage protein
VALPNLPDLKTHLNMTGTSNDAELQDILDAAIELVENIVGPLEPGTVTEVHRATSAVSTLVLRRVPVSALTAVSARYGSTVLTPLTLADYELDAATGIVRLVNGGYFAGDYVVQYTAGFGTVPASVRLATLIIAAHLWETQRGAAGSPLAQQQAEYDQAAPLGLGFAIPARAQSLLEPYRLTQVA